MGYHCRPSDSMDHLKPLFDLLCWFAEPQEADPEPRVPPGLLEQRRGGRPLGLAGGRI